MNFLGLSAGVCLVFIPVACGGLGDVVCSLSNSIRSKMALQEESDRFKKQQEECQSTLSNIAAKAESSNVTTTAKSTPVPAPNIARSPAPAVRFSNDTERLQHINSIRKAPVGAQIKRVMDLLMEVE